MYDMIFVTHLPAFYKINLYNEISRHKKILVIFIADGSSIRNSDFTSGQALFENYVINKGSFEKRNPLLSFAKLAYFLRNKKYLRLVVGGWDLFEYWALVFFMAKRKNAIVVESSVYESAVFGVRRLLKKLFLKRVSLAYCSGKPHVELVSSVGFSGETITTGGVGIANGKVLGGVPGRNDYQKKFLYVGRLSKEKDVIFLVEFFSSSPEYKLTIAGEGPFKEYLEEIASENVTFLGYVDNQDISRIYEEHDVFILPSVSEPWGLVIEEALSYGLPVICSDKVGSSFDLVLANDVGVLFSSHSSASLQSSILELEKNLQHYKNNVDNLDINLIRDSQVRSYLLL